jgi:hypothetical protein
MPPSARKPNSAEEETPLHDQLKKDLETADPEDVTLFEEDDDPLSNVGELIDDDETAENKENS